MRRNRAAHPYTLSLGKGALCYVQPPGSVGRVAVACGGARTGGPEQGPEVRQELFACLWKWEGGAHLLPACKKNCCFKKSKVQGAWQSWCERGRDELGMISSGWITSQVKSWPRVKQTKGPRPFVDKLRAGHREP